MRDRSSPARAFTYFPSSEVFPGQSFPETNILQKAEASGAASSSARWRRKGSDPASTWGGTRATGVGDGPRPHRARVTCFTTVSVGDARGQLEDAW